MKRLVSSSSNYVNGSLGFNNTSGAGQSSINNLKLLVGYKSTTSTQLSNGVTVFSSSSFGNGSGKIYSKATASKVASGFKYLGFGLSAYSAFSTETDYNSGNITGARRKFNHVNTAIGVVFQGAGLAIGIGDHVGQKYEPQITHSVTQGGLNQFVTGCLEACGVDANGDGK